MSIRAQLSTLIQLANADGEFSGEEKQLIYMIGKANRLNEEEIDKLIDHPEEMPPVSTMTDQDKFEYLYNVVQLMKIDRGQIVNVSVPPSSNVTVTIPVVLFLPTLDMPTAFIAIDTLSINIPRPPPSP